MPAQLQEKINRYRRWQDAQACLLGYTLLMMACDGLGFDGKACIGDVRVTDLGRPFIQDLFDFNLSHSGTHVVCAISDRSRIGIDIEAVRDVELADFRYQMTEAEWEAITKAVDPLRAFFRLWTVREAALKAAGLGLRISMKDVGVQGNQVTVDGTSWHVLEVPITQDVVCHIATEDNADIPEVRSDIQDI
jgi:4'-phosphopantetheinyl transferase